MKAIRNKLRFVRIYANAEIQLRLTDVIDKLLLADSTPPEDVSGKELDDTTEVATPLSVLQDNTDEFLVLMRTLPDDHELKKSIRILDLIANKLRNSMVDVASQLKDILASDEEDIPQGDLNELAELIEANSNNFSDIIEFAGIMDKMAQQSEEEQKHKPVEHKLEKIKLGPKKKKEEDKIELDTSKEDKDKKVKNTVEKLDDLIKLK